MNSQRRHLSIVLLGTLVVSCGAPASEPESAGGPWKLTTEGAEAAEAVGADTQLESRIFRALDAAAGAGTDPSHSKYHVRAGTVVEHNGGEVAIVGGNSEYAGYPEAIHGETSLMNHVISTVGPEAAKADVDFLAFYTDRQCGGGGSCGDCRDYLMTTTRWEDLLVVCGQSSDHSVHVQRFADMVVPEAAFQIVEAGDIDLEPERLAELVAAALEARDGGVALFTDDEEHLGVAALSARGEIYRAAGADDAAFHYRYPIGAALQQAATYRDYFIDAVVVAGAGTPRVSYRDRQYGFEFSSFNAKRGLPPIQLILIETDSEKNVLTYRRTTFEEALPGAFSSTSFMPEAVDDFLADRAEP